jgi:hypothetical protein
VSGDFYLVRVYMCIRVLLCIALLLADAEELVYIEICNGHIDTYNYDDLDFLLGESCALNESFAKMFRFLGEWGREGGTKILR